MIKSYFNTICLLTGLWMLLAVTGCTIEGPAGPAGEPGSIFVPEGYIAYTMTGTRQDGVPFSEKDSLIGVQYGSTIWRQPNGAFRARIERFRSNAPFAFLYLSFSGDSTFSSISASWAELAFNRVIDNTSLFSFDTQADLFPSSNEDKVIVSGVVWDRAGGRISGNFAITGNKNSSKHPVTINGHFDVAIQETVNRP